MNDISIIKIALAALCLPILGACVLPTPMPVPSVFVDVDKSRSGKVLLHSPTCFRFKGKLYVTGGYLKKSSIPAKYVPRIAPFQEIYGIQYRTKIILNDTLYEITDEEKAFIIESRIRQNNIVSNSSVKKFAIDPENWKTIGTVNSLKVMRNSNYYFEFKGDLYVIGGIGHEIGKYEIASDMKYDDVWKSTDLKHWKRISENVPWSGDKKCKNNYTIAATSDSMYLIGGADTALNEEPRACDFSGIWKSRDGIHWKNETGTLVPLVGSRVLKCNGMFFHVGNRLKTLYVSDDGIHWQIRLDTSQMFNRHEKILKLGIMNDKLAMIVSPKEEEDVINHNHDLYLSTDGLEWRHSKSGEKKTFAHFGSELANDFSSNYTNDFTLVEFKNDLLLIGQNPDNLFKSRDGLAWEKIAAPKHGFQQRTGAAIGVYNGYLWIMGGAWNSSVALGDIWRSSDGQNWERVSNNAPWGTSLSSSILASKGRLYLVKHGIQWDLQKGVAGQTREIWSTKDCITWRMESGNTDNVFIEAHNRQHIDRAIETGEALYFLDDKQHTVFIDKHYTDTVQSTFFLDNFDPPNIAEIKEKGEKPVYFVVKPRTFWLSYNLHDWQNCELENGSNNNFETVRYLFHNDTKIRKPVFFKNKLFIVGADFLNQRVYSSEILLNTDNCKIKSIRYGTVTNSKSGNKLE